MNDLLAECRDLALTVAPELRERPLYVISHSQIKWLPFNDCLGLAIGDAIDLPTRDAIGDQWEGLGPVIVLDDKRHGQSNRDVLATMVHEVGHIVPAKKPRDCTTLDFPFDASALKEWQQSKHVELMALPAAELGSAEDCHDWRFIRRTIHAWARAQAAGYRVPIEKLWEGCWYPRAEHWLPLLAGEAMRMQHLPFSEIEEEPAPFDFMSKWQDCVDFYLACIRKKENT